MRLSRLRSLPSVPICFGHVLWSSCGLLFLLCHNSNKVRTSQEGHLRYPAASLEAIISADEAATIAAHMGEAVDCSIGNESAGLIFLTSTGLGTWGPGNSLLPNSNLTLAFRDLILRLPDSAWEGGDGAARKERASRRDLKHLSAESFKEPDLYGGLEVVILEDNCFLSESFWNEADPNFHISSGIGLNYKIANMTTDVDVIKPFFGRGLYPGWCVNFASNRPGYLGGLGFDEQRLHHVSLFDRLANESSVRDVFELQVSGATQNKPHDLKVGTRSGDAAALRDILGSADVVVVNGGDPDFGKYVFTLLAADVMTPLVDRVRAGSLVYVGQSAGSMDASADMGLSYEPTPSIFEGLDHEDTRGLGLAGRCAIRPHDAGKLWDLAASMYGSLKNITVLRLANGEGLHCVGADCHVVGVTGRSGASVFAGAKDSHLQRLLEVFGLSRAGAATS